MREPARNHPLPLVLLIGQLEPAGARDRIERDLLSRQRLVVLRTPQRAGQSAERHERRRAQAAIRLISRDDLIPCGLLLFVCVEVGARTIVISCEVRDRACRPAASADHKCLKLARWDHALGARKVEHREECLT
jgi:hypothetical protein